MTWNLYGCVASYFGLPRAQGLRIIPFHGKRRREVIPGHRWWRVPNALRDPPNGRQHRDQVGGLPGTCAGRGRNRHAHRGLASRGLSLPEGQQDLVWRRLFLVALAGLAVVCAALIADLFYTANAATWDELGLMEALVDILTETQFGTWLLVRLGVSIVLGVLLYRVLSAGTRSLGYILGAMLR